MPVLAQGKYQLKSLHEEIDLFDRKMAHVLRFEQFACDADRAAELKRLRTKRELLVRAAAQMVHDGIEYNDSELPRSFRAEQDPPVAETAAPVSGEEATEEPRKPAQKFVPSPYANTALDFRKTLKEYKRKKSKA